MKKLFLLSLLLVGCGEINTYELKDIIELCGGHEKIHSIWIDTTIVRARCLDGNLVESINN